MPTRSDQAAFDAIARQVCTREPSGSRFECPVETVRDMLAGLATTVSVDLVEDLARVVAGSRSAELLEEIAVEHGLDTLVLDGLRTSDVGSLGLLERVGLGVLLILCCLIAAVSLAG